MAVDQCIIDEAYCVAMGEYCKRQGQRIEEMLEEYLAVLRTVRDEAVQKGQVNAVLDAYIAYAEKMKGNVSLISDNANAQVLKFLNRVDEADQYLF